MELAQIREIFDREQRCEVEFPGSIREETPYVVRHVHMIEPEGFLLYSRLSEENADRVIAEQVSYYSGLGKDLEWKLYDYDTPADLGERLAACGFQPDEPEAVEVLDLQSAPGALLEPVGLDVRRVRDGAGVSQAMRVEEGVWKKEFSDLEQFLIRDLSEDPERISIYIAYAGDHPAACAWTYFHPGSRFASLWGGSTLAEYRGQGFYTALLAVRAQEAIQRGVRFLSVDASPMSRPILEKFGFRCIGTTTPYKWEAPKV